MPLLTAIVPARNEEANIAACVASLLVQELDLNVLVANDGSTDATAAIVAEMASRDQRIRLLDVPQPPPGWVGKNHALDFAARQAAACQTPPAWLLFTDADTVHAPGSLRRVLEKAEDFDMLSLSPDQELCTWWEKAINPRVYRELETLYRFEEINRAGTEAAAANGQYILIRRGVYERLGGHAALRGEILEDVALARAVKRAGRRLFFGPGAGLVRTRMYRSFPALWQGWTKNLFLLYGRSTRRLLGAALRILALDLFPVALALLFPALWLWVIWRHLWYAGRLGRSGASPYLALYMLPGAMIFLGLLGNSRAKYRSGHTIRWKGREYAPWST